MKVIFLDFDGVLNSDRWLAVIGQEWTAAGQGAPIPRPRHIDPAAVGLLNQLVDRTGAVVVVSSAWRTLGITECRAILRQRGCVARVVGATPLFVPRQRLSERVIRGREIRAWLSRRRKVERFVVLDDMGAAEFEGMWDSLVQTDGRKGLTQDDVERAVRILNAPAAGMVANG